MDENTTLGRFRLDAVDNKEHPLLRSTQHADVYRGVDTVLKRTVILRVFKPDRLNDQRLRSQLVQSLQRLAELVHPHIAWVWDIGEESGRVFSAERFVEGKLLEDVLLVERRLPWENAYSIFRQIAQALEFAHEHNVFHGDLKPDQVTLSPEHGAIVEGFGLNQVFAVFENGSPEVPVNRQSDQQALAKLLIEIVAGPAPHSADSPFPTHWPLGIPRLIEEPLRRALGLHPAGPFTNLDEFVIAILEKASQPQPALSAEEIALLQAEEEALQVAKEADRKAAEEAIRQIALENARREINEQLQKGMEERVFLDTTGSEAGLAQTDVPAGSLAEVFVPETELETVLQATELSSLSTPAEKIEKTSNEQSLPEAGAAGQDDVQSAPQPVPPSSQKKKSRRRVFAWLLLILIILLISGLFWAYLNGYVVLPFRI